MAYYYSPFRRKYNKNPGNICPFCDKKNINKRKIHSNSSWYWIVNGYPKFEGHTLLVPKRHITKIGQETKKETLDRESLIIHSTKTLNKLFPQAGFEIFLQTGAGSESTIDHLHWHVVPASPTDPLRSFDKLGQFYTVKRGKERVVLFPVRIKRSPQQLRKALSHTTPKRRK